MATTPYNAPLSDDGFTNASAASGARAPDPWMAAPYNGNIDAWIADEVRSGRNFSSWLNRPEAASAYERYRAGVNQAQEDRMNSPEYREMVRLENIERQRKQEAARDSTGSGFSLSNIARAAAGTIAAPAILARQTPGLAQALPVVAPVYDATQQATQAAQDAVLPGGSGLTRQQGGVINRTLDRAGVVDAADQGDLPSAGAQASPASRRSTGASAGAGAGASPTVAAEAGRQTSTEELARRQAGADESLSLYQGTVGQQGDALRGESEESVSDYEEGSANLASEAQSRLFGRFDPVFKEIDALETDSAKIYDRMLAAELARLSATPGGAAGQAAAQFQAANNPALYAQAEDAVAANQQRKTDIMLRATESLNDDDLALVGQAQSALNNVLATESAISQKAASLTSEEQMRLGALLVDLQGIISRERIAFEGMTSQEAIAALQEATRRYGIDTHFEEVMRSLAEGSDIDAKDIMNGILGLAGAVVSTRKR